MVAVVRSLGSLEDTHAQGATNSLVAEANTALLLPFVSDLGLEEWPSLDKGVGKCREKVVPALASQSREKGLPFVNNVFCYALTQPCYT